MLNDDGLYGFQCLRCHAITQCSHKIMVPGDDTPTWLTLGQRETVSCPICRENKTAEFVEITRLNASRVVDYSGRPVQIPRFAGFAQPPPPPPAPVSVGGAASQMPQPPPPMMAPTAPIGGGAAPALMGDRDFERYVASLSDDRLRQLRQDMQVKLAVVESALTERRKCIVCVENDRSVVLLPCKHMLMCEPCCLKVTACPSCRVNIADRIMPYQ